MNHSKSLENVPDVTSKEFEDFLKDHNFKYKTLEFNKKQDSADEPNDSDNHENDQTESVSVGSVMYHMLDNWITKNPDLSLALFIGGSLFIAYKMSVGMLSQGIFKGNLKTARYFAKHAQ